MANSSTSWSKKSWDKGRLLPVSFYLREAPEVARDLLGKILVARPRLDEVRVKDPEQVGVTAARIVETEAYQGNDPASHSARGETPRSSVMFGEPAVAYVYFIYGMYEMLNFVTGPKGVPGAVLIRAVEPLLGEPVMYRRRGCDPEKARSRFDLTRGPGRLCQAMGIQMSHNRESLRGPLLEVRDDGYIPEAILVSPRVGIRAGTDRYWRYFIAGNPFVSRAPQNAMSVRI